MLSFNTLGQFLVQILECLHVSLILRTGGHNKNFQWIISGPLQIDLTKGASCQQLMIINERNFFHFGSTALAFPAALTGYLLPTFLKDLIKTSAQ